MAHWKLQKKIGKQRVGTLTTRSGVIQTPFFMPDATRASVRGLGTDDVEGAGIEALVVNTYHLYLQPGADLVQKAGGVHRFMQWPRPLLSDSGGYQIYSLIHKNPGFGQITEEGAHFRSILDGSKHMITPERSIQVQFDLGVDMLVCLDDPRPNTAPATELGEAVERTIRWAARCKAEYDKQVRERGLDEATRPLIFGVIQGGMSRALRKHCTEGLIDIGFDGYGFGARHVDAEGKFLSDILEYTASIIPEGALRSALGVGTPEDIVRCAAYGWDMFDCVIPTREGRHGRLFLWKNGLPVAQNLSPDFYETINITNEQYREDFTPVDSTCDCLLCKHYSRGYLRHLFTVGEPLAGRLASIHNLRFYSRLMEALRQ